MENLTLIPDTETSEPTEKINKNKSQNVSYPQKSRWMIWYHPPSYRWCLLRRIESVALLESRRI